MIFHSKKGVHVLLWNQLLWQVKVNDHMKPEFDLLQKTRGRAQSIHKPPISPHLERNLGMEFWWILEWVGFFQTKYHGVGVCWGTASHCNATFHQGFVSWYVIGDGIHVVKQTDTNCTRLWARCKKILNLGQFMERFRVYVPIILTTLSMNSASLFPFAVINNMFTDFKLLRQPNNPILIVFYFWICILDIFSKMGCRIFQLKIMVLWGIFLFPCAWLMYLYVFFTCM